MFVVTAVGVGIDTEVKVCNSSITAHSIMEQFIEEYKIKDFENICSGCIKGFSHTAQCDVEIEIHLTNYSVDEKTRKKAESVLVDNGIEDDESDTVLQALGFVLLDTDLYDE